MSILVISNQNSFECCLMKLLPYISFEKNVFIFYHWGNGQHGKPALYQCVGALLFPIVREIQRFTLSA